MLPDDFQKKLQEHYLSSLPGILEDLESNALQLEKEHGQRETYFAIYRQAHSLKGSGGTYGYPIISTICHQFEDYLSEFEDVNKTVNGDTTDQILRFIDLLKATSEKMLAGDNDFNDIENKLKEIKSLHAQTQLAGLVVDSSKSNAKLIAAGLSGPRISITQSYDGIDALQRLLHKHYDFLITSKEVSTLNGLALVAAVRLGSKHNKNIKAVLVTSDKSFSNNKEYQIDQVVIKDKNFIQTITTFVNALNTN
ncbi:MAG: Hpt domain-containing protein [Gammaproteobacteria bacterium]|nr:Hpt domain-containing protein [Gammaproteobacteria bacterium]